MRGWQLTNAHEPLKLVYLPDPVPGKGEIAIDIKAAGLCHSDVGLMEGITTSQLAFLPMVIGHEFSGIVSAVGEGVTDFKVGDKVACTAGFESPGVKCNGAYANKRSPLQGSAPKYRKMSSGCRSLPPQMQALPPITPLP